MKLTMLFLTVGFFNVSAIGVSQSVSFSGKNVSLEKVFIAVSKQTGYVFFYKNSLLKEAKPVSVNAENSPLETFLKDILKGQPFEYNIENKNIIITRKSFSPQPSSGTFDYLQDTTIDVSGRVTDGEGRPLPGANVKVRGSSVGITTDNNGNFSLRNIPENSVLEISFVGHEMKIFTVRGTGFMTISLDQKLSMLDETIVIAYGQTTRRLATGNISTIKAADIDRQPVQNPLLTLQGRVPGLLVTQSNGLPGSGITVRIQGQNSIGSGNDPLYVIDGVPYVSQMLSTTTGGTGNILGNSGGILGRSGQGNPLSYINPKDIESIEVLKDADATAIYGSRAANGAILITTKKGKVGVSRLDIDFQKGEGHITRKIALMNTSQFIEMRKEAIKNDNATIGSADYDINGLWDTTRYTDWQKELLGKGAKYVNVNATFSGGSNNFQYLVGSTYHKETTVFPGNFSDKRGSVHINLNSTNKNERLRLQVSASYLADKNRLPASDFTTVALQLPPNAPAIYNSDGTLNWMPTTTGTSSWVNPMASTSRTYENETKNLVSNAIIAYKILRNLEIKSSFGYNNLQSNEIQTSPTIAQAPETRPLITRSANYTNSTINSWIIEPQVSYKSESKLGKVDALLGFTIQQNNNKGLNLNGSGFNSDLVLADIRSAATVRVNGTVASMYKYNAAFMRVNYNWRDKLIVNLNARRDGSSRFGSENMFHNFGSIAGGWIFSNEKIFNRNTTFFSYGKLKASYGTTGNDQIGDYFFMDLYNPISPANPYQNTTGLLPNGIANPYLQWEKTKKLNLGLDLGFLNDRLFLSINCARNKSSNQLLSYSLPIITGVDGITSNFPAIVQNTSWELLFNSLNIKSNSFSWRTNFNLTVPRNKLIDFPNLETSTYNGAVIVGEPLNIRKVFRYLGVDPLTGVHQFQDAHGNPTFNPDPSTDNTVIVDPSPKFYGGFQNSVSYKGLQIDFLFQFIKQISNGASYSFGAGLPPGYRRINQPLSVLNRWQKPGDITSIQRYNSNLSLRDQYNLAKSSNAGWEDASFIRLKNVSISYIVKEKWIKVLHLRSANIYMQGQNLFTITKFKGMDPENQSINSLPPLRVIIFGIQLGL